VGGDGVASAPEVNLKLAPLPTLRRDAKSPPFGDFPLPRKNATLPPARRANKPAYSFLSNRRNIDCEEGREARREKCIAGD